MSSFEHKIVNVWYWLVGDIANFAPLKPGTWGFIPAAAAVLLVTFFGGVLISFLTAAFRKGPTEGLNTIGRALFSAITEDLPRFSLRRTLAIAYVVWKEAIRNRIIVGFAVFLVVLVFASLFFAANDTNPGRVYLATVFWTSNWLVVIMAVLLACFSIPNDIKNRTIHTVVTKPVRAGEIVLGRVVGVASVCTCMLLAMALTSYIFVWRGMEHTHAIDVKTITPVRDDSGAITHYAGQTTGDGGHKRHNVQISADKTECTVEEVAGHYHQALSKGPGEFEFVLSGPIGSLQAKSPLFGDLVILDRNGSPGSGINVGDEWEYRGYIEGGANTRSAAIFTFRNITRERFPKGLPLEMNLQVFRTYKGKIEQTIMGEIRIVNPDPEAAVSRSGPIPFFSQEFKSDRRIIPVELESEDAGNRKIDLFDELVSPDGVVQVMIKCSEPGQYFGVARPDVYLLGPEGYFELNFLKGYFSIWLQVLLVACLSVTLSTALNGPVTLATAVSLALLGLNGEFIRGIAFGKEFGGGPLEAFIRLITQQNVMTDLELPYPANIFVSGFDTIVIHIMMAATYLVPDFGLFDSSQFVVNGVNIYSDVMAQQLITALVYASATLAVGYFIFKSREVAE